eukprot:scaffold36873_cov112-Isochrysis_galbana.AAC.1
MSFQAREPARRASRGTKSLISRAGYATFWYGDKVAEVTPSATDGKPVMAVVVRVVVAEAEKGKGAGKAKGGRKFLVLREWDVPSPCFFVGNWGDWQRIPKDEGKGWDGHDPDEHDALWQPS